MTILLLILGVVLTLIAPAAAYAEVPVKGVFLSKQERFVAAIVTQDIPVYLYPETPVRNVPDLHVLRKALQKSLSNHHIVYVTKTSDALDSLKEKVPNGNLHHARAKIDIGYAETHYLNGNFEAAIKLLKSISGDLSEALSYYYDPALYSQLYQQLAYAYLDQYRNNPSENLDYFRHARDSFLEMIRSAPHLVMQRGRQPEARVKAYEEAKRLFLDNAAIRETPVQHAEKIAQILPAEILLFLRLVQDGKGALLFEVDYYDANNNQLRNFAYFLSEEDMVEQNIVDFFEGILSRELACLSPKAKLRQANTVPKNRHFIDMSFSHSYYLLKKIDKNPPSLGLAVRYSYLFSNNLFISSLIDIAYTIKDRDGEMIHPFIASKIDVGIGLAYGYDLFRQYIIFGVGTEIVSKYKTTESIKCKIFGENDYECNDIQSYDNRVRTGITVSGGFNVNFDPISLLLEISSGLYFIPGADGHLNFPTGYRFGLQYRF